MIDATHDPNLRCWVSSAKGHADFPVQNLPFGIFSPPDAAPRGGVAIGDCILDLRALADGSWLDGTAREAAQIAGHDTLNEFLSRGAGHRRALRCALSSLLSESRPPAGMAQLLYDASTCRLWLPAAIGDYTDFYAGIHHATGVGRLFRPDAPLLPNYKYLPVAYHGRASSVRPSGTEVRRPRGQIRSPSCPAPTYEPTRGLDFELELGVWVGEESALGSPVPIAQTARHVAGYCLLNDWSARDIQAFEYQPLGPFLAKNFLTTISPWIVTPEALEPFRIPQAARPAADPRPLPHLWDEADQAHGALCIGLEVWLCTRAMRDAGIAAERISISNSRHLYWTVAQMLAHHTSGGCNLRPGDLIGSGTITADDGGYGSLLELCLGGTRPFALGNGERRTYLEDGDEVTLRARADRPGFASLGFGDCRGRVVAA